MLLALSLLRLFQEAERILKNVEQSPYETMQDALWQPCMRMKLHVLLMALLKMATSRTRLNRLMSPLSISDHLEAHGSNRKCKDTEIDVHIIDDDVTIKLVQRKKIINCLVYDVLRALDELELKLHHVAGGHVDDYYSYLFNSKIFEGSSIYTGVIANKLIEVLEKEYMSAFHQQAVTRSRVEEAN